MEKNGKKYLKEGIMTAKEVAEWFGVTSGTYSRNKNKYWKMLGEYALYDCEVNGRVYIKQVICPEYIDCNSSTYKRVKTLTYKYWDESGIDKKVRVAEKIEKGPEGKNLPIAASTLYNYVCKGSTEMWRASR